MANCCFHNGSFYGNAETIPPLKKEIKRMIKMEKEKHEGQLPKGCRQKYGWFLDLEIADSDDTSISLSYWCKWSPNLKVLEYICKKFCVDMSFEYEERGNLIVGRAVHQSGEFYDVQVADDILMNEVEEDDETGLVSYKGVEYGSMYDVYDLLLDEAEAKHHNEKSTITY